MGSTSEANNVRSASRQVIRLLEIANGLAVATPDRAPGGLPAVSDMLAAVRDTLGADVVFVARFDEAHRRFIAVSKAKGSLVAIEPGGADLILDTYCRLVIERRIPPVIPDTLELPLTASLPITKALGIGAYVSAPVLRPDGGVFGTLCAVYHAARPELRDDIGTALRELADALGRSVAPDGTFDQVAWPVPAGSAR
jgi:GAF domain-containing protein